MSIDKLHVSLGDVFCEGQAYVALSRATCKAGLEIRGFSPSIVKVNVKALEFDRTGSYTGQTWLQEAHGGWGQLLEQAEARSHGGGGGGGGGHGHGRACMDCGAAFDASDPKWMIRCRRCYARHKNSGGAHGGGGSAESGRGGGGRGARGYGGHGSSWRKGGGGGGGGYMSR